MTAYPPPLDRLLALGRPDEGRDWREYLSLGLTPGHVPDLIRMMQDPALNRADSEGAEVWAPVHAWRALSELKALDAAGPYLDQLDVFHREDDGGADWMSGDAQPFFVRLGPPALPVLATRLADATADPHTRWVAASCMTAIAEAAPETRAEVVATLTRQMEQAASNGEVLNGGLVSELIELQAMDALPAIEQAFAAGQVDETMTGDWDYVQSDFGLIPKPDRPRYPEFAPLLDALDALKARGDTRRAETKQRNQAKAKRKQERQNRKKNRKRKR